MKKILLSVIAFVLMGVAYAGTQPPKCIKGESRDGCYARVVMEGNNPLVYKLKEINDHPNATAEYRRDFNNAYRQFVVDIKSQCKLSEECLYEGQQLQMKMLTDALSSLKQQAVTNPQKAEAKPKANCSVFNADLKYPECRTGKTRETTSGL